MRSKDDKICYHLEEGVGRSSKHEIIPLTGHNAADFIFPMEKLSAGHIEFLLQSFKYRVDTGTHTD